MKIIVLYGPPAAGKLTVARELARLTGFKVLHGHLIADFIAFLMPFGTKGFLALHEGIRLELLKAAARSGKIRGVILTAVYEPTGRVELNEKHISKIQAIAKGRVWFIRLKCDEKELYRRVKGRSRQAFKKIHEKGDLRRLLKRFRFDTAVRVKGGLTIDNTKLSALECARQIRVDLKL